ncbi:MAG TPA: DNA polymerase III subunit delta [Candidatus Saccharimonadales bacterium]
MIYFLSGENWYGRDLALKALLKNVGVEAIERPDTTTLDASELRDMLRAQSLFSEKRCIVFSNLSENKPVWEVLGDSLDAVSSDITLIFVEDKPDKRTRTYKALQKHAKTEEFSLWTPRDTPRATEWLLAVAKSQNIPLKTRHAKQMIELVGVDQARLAKALEKLALADEINEQIIEAVVDQSPNDSIFTLLESALKGDIAEVRQSIVNLSQIEDAYKVFGLLSSQILQIGALVFAGEKSSGEVAKDIGAHPFVLSKLAPYAKRIDHSRAKLYIDMAAKTDMQLKSTSVDPWTLVEKLLGEIAISSQ